MNETIHIILEALQAGDKTIYQIFKEKVKKINKPKNEPKTSYPPVNLMVKKLAKQGLIEETKKKKVSPRKEKWHKITRAGMAMLYILRRGDREELEFHHSEEAKELIEGIYQWYRTYSIGESVGERSTLFREALDVSPSLVTFFKEVDMNVHMIDLVRIMKDMKTINNYSPGEFFYHMIPDDIAYGKKFLGMLLPIECLARDYYKYWGDTSKDSRWIDMIKDVLAKYLLLQMDEDKKERQTAERLKKENCSFESVIYIPPMGQPTIGSKIFKRD